METDAETDDEGMKDAGGATDADAVDMDESGGGDAAVASASEERAEEEDGATTSNMMPPPLLGGGLGDPAPEGVPHGYASDSPLRTTLLQGSQAC